MGLNKKFVKMKNDKRAEMGVGTMIIFIAMVLVAAVAASVLISTANTVREQAQSTGSQAINNVASGFIIQDVVGTVDTSDYNNITQIDVYIRLSAGSPNVMMDNVMVSLLSGDNNMYLEFGTSAANETQYQASQTKIIANVPWTAGSHVVGQGDLIKVTIIPEEIIKYSQAGEIKIIPAYGQAQYIQFVTPESFSTAYVTLA
jgi:flagellin FlaB